MAGLGREVGMSSGHILYYFGTKDELLLQTLQWSEEQLGVERRAALSRRYRPRTAGRAGRPVLPQGHRDPRWTLWPEVWNRSQNADEETLERQLELELVWHRDLVALLVEGISKGEFRPVDPERFATRIRALLDGFGSRSSSACPARTGNKCWRHIRNSWTSRWPRSPVRERNARKYA